MMEKTRSVLINKIKRSGTTWINIVNPTHKDIQNLAKEFKFHELDLEDCLSSVQRPKIDLYDDYIFVVMHFPRYLKNTRRLKSTEVDFFIGKDYIITLHNGEQKILNNLFDELGTDEVRFEEYVQGGSGKLFYEILNLLYSNCFPMVDKIYEKIETLDASIFEQEHKPSVFIHKLSDLRHELINFKRIIKPQREVVRQLENLKTKFIDEKVEVYFDDIGDQVEKIWDLLENQKEITESLSTTYESIVSNKTNEIIKILTLFSVIMLPLTLISGIFGMNLKNLPLSEGDFAIEIIIGIMLFISISMIAYFNKKGWL